MSEEENGSMTSDEEQKNALRAEHARGYEAGKNRTQRDCQRSFQYAANPLTAPDATLIEALGFSTRVYNFLKRERKGDTLGDLTNLTKEDLLGIWQFGHGGVREVINVLKKFGRTLKTSPPE